MESQSSDYGAEESYEEEIGTDPSLALAESLQSLPLIGDDPYLRMQAFNLGLVSNVLDEMESQLLREYLDGDGTPSSAITVSAISHLWVFGLYELLRTWRQRGFEIAAFGAAIEELAEEVREERITEKIERLRAASADPEFANPSVLRSFEIAARDERFRRSLRLALDRSEVTFRKLEALRVHLAKHEIPKSKELYGMAPGYGRIDESTGSIFWQFPLGKMEVDMVSRRTLCEMSKRFPNDESIMILPENLQIQNREFREDCLRRQVRHVDHGGRQRV